MALTNLNIGWGRSIKETLQDYDLPTNLETIRVETRRRWKKAISEKIEIKNKVRLYDDCHKYENGVKIPKTKTKHIIEQINNSWYQRAPSNELLQCTKQETKTILIARFGMLECGKNFKGTMREVCTYCNELDNENHRLNYCVQLKDINLFNSDVKANFDDIYSNDIDKIKGIIMHIEKVWNVKTAHGNIHR